MIKTSFTIGMRNRIADLMHDCKTSSMRRDVQQDTADELYRLFGKALKIMDEGMDY